MKTRFLRCIALAASLAAPAALAGEIAAAGVFDCPAASGGTHRIEFDERLPIAVIDDEEHPADYNVWHVRIRLDPEGRMLTIGRLSGRILASAPGSEPTLLGHCTARLRT